MQTTGNLGLKKPEGTDIVNIEDLNGNMDILDGEVVKLASTTEAGRMSAADKAKLNGVAAGANNYVHPSSHPASMITQDASNRFVTDTEKAAWNAKAGTAAATASANGLMSAADKNKLDSVAAGANNYSHPNGDGNLHVPATGTTNSGKVLKAGATAGSAAWGAVNASEVVENATRRFATDTEKAAWNAKAGTTNATASINGLMSAADKGKLDGIAAGANNYVHPSSHPASIIVQDANNRLVTDAEKSLWNAKASTALATTSSNGLMTSADKATLNNVSGYGITGGTGAAYTVTLSPAPTALIAGLRVTVRFHVSNTSTTPTINVNGFGAKTIIRPSGVIPEKLIKETVYSLVYDGTNFILQGEGGEYYKGSKLDSDKVIPPFFRRGSRSGMAAVRDSKYFYTLGAQSKWQKYDLDGSLLLTFGASGLNDSTYIARETIYPVPNSDYIYYKSFNSYTGRLHLGLATRENVNSSTIFTQTKDQNSWGGSMGILGVFPDGSLLYYWHDGSNRLSKTNGTSSSVSYTIQLYSISGGRYFFPMDSGNLLYFGTYDSYNNYFIYVINESGTQIQRVSYAKNGLGSMYLPYGSFFDYKNNDLYVLSADGELKKFSYNPISGSLTLVKSRDANYSFFNQIWSNLHQIRIAGIFGENYDKLVFLNVETGKVGVLDTDLEDLEVKQEEFYTGIFDYFSENMQSVKNNTAYLVGNGLIYTDTRYTLV